MVQQTAVATRQPVDMEAVSRALGGQSLSITPQYVENTVHSLTLLQELVHKVLQPNRDYGRVPGIPYQFLWDPGAQAITASFNCHFGQRRLLNHVDDGKRLSVIIEVPIIHNIAQVEVGSGIGAATVAETKNKYRWEAFPQDFGYSEEDIAKLPSKQQGEDRTVYQILNPEPSELLNIIIKNASKRAEVDAAEGLPGAASALKELFDPKGEGKYKRANSVPGGQGQSDKARYTSFWGKARILLESLAQQRHMQVNALAHELLNVKSMEDWEKAGHSLDDGLRTLSEVVAKQATPAGEKQAPSSAQSEAATSSSPDTEGPFGEEHQEEAPGDPEEKLGYVNKEWFHSVLKKLQKINATAYSDEKLRKMLVTKTKLQDATLDEQVKNLMAEEAEKLTKWLRAEMEVHKIPVE